MKKLSFRYINYLLSVGLLIYDGEIEPKEVKIKKTSHTIRYIDKFNVKCI